MQRILEFTIEWDEAKAHINLQKHGLSFEAAAYVFADSHRIEFYDSMHSSGEDRYITIGMVNNLITVVYTERSENIRLISARVSTAAERKLYYDNHR
ncbi:BrnT family toxin [Candidatus Saccharibacteria bacterium]|nr:BrnT family toxin [Candidatus Saccharibacteria bacterium]